jgi:DNA-binding transcriptional LysR family regulator
MMNLQQLRYFQALGEELHFRRAAERLRLSQPALTRSIQQLESAAGFALLTRDNRNVALTPAGEEYLKGCRSILAMMDTMTDRARRLARGDIGSVRIGYTDIAVAGILPAVVRTFRSACPDITIEANHGCSQAQIDDLETDKLDVGFFTGPWSRKGYTTWVVQEDAFVAVLPAQHPLARKPTLSLGDLAEEAFVLGEPRFWTHYHAHLNRLCRTAGFEPNVVQYASNNEGILGLVACGMGVTIQAESIRTYGRGDVVMRLLETEDAEIPTIAAWRDEPMNAVKERLIAHVKSLYPKPVRAQGTVPPAEFRVDTNSS